MITCPWCGSTYISYQPKCDNCGGSLPVPVEIALTPPGEGLPAPPPAPRELPRNHAWRILLADGWTIFALIFGFIGAVFAVVGLGLAILVVTALLGLLFGGLGILFLAIALPILAWRYSHTQQTVHVLRVGEAALGRIEDVRENFAVQVNGRFPWTITYQFEVAGRSFHGKVTTLSTPSLKQQPGKPVYVLYLEDDPTRNTIYPNPYGYLST